MFEVGFTELLLISVLALIVLGPERLPKVAQQLGRWVGRARAMARQFRDQLEEEASLEPAPRRPRTASSESQSSSTAYTPPAPAAEPVPDVHAPEVVASTDHETQHAETSAPAPESTASESPVSEMPATVTAHVEPHHERGT